MKENKNTCIDCRFFDICEEGETTCHCNKHDIDINIIKETEEECILDRDICEDFDEARYILTEKGILYLVLSDLGLISDINDKRINTAWELFVETAKKYGFYREEGEEDKDCQNTDTDKTVKDVFQSAIRVVFKEKDEETLDAIWMLFYKGMKKAEYF